MKNCRDVEELMSLALDKAATDAEQRELDAHLACCEECAIVWGAMSEASAMMWQSPMLAPPAGFVQSVVVALKARERRARQQRQNVATVVSLAALLATVGLLVALGFGALWADAATFRLVLTAFFEEGVAAFSLLIKGFEMPLRLLGPAPVGLALVALIAFVGGCSALWAWALVRIDRRARSVLGNGLGSGAMNAAR